MPPHWVSTHPLLLCSSAPHPPTPHVAGRCCMTTCPPLLPRHTSEPLRACKPCPPSFHPPIPCTLCPPPSSPPLPMLVGAPPFARAGCWPCRWPPPRPPASAGRVRRAAPAAPAGWAARPPCAGLAAQHTQRAQHAWHTHTLMWHTHTHIHSAHSRQTHRTHASGMGGVGVSNIAVRCSAGEAVWGVARTVPPCTAAPSCSWQ